MSFGKGDCDLKQEEIDHNLQCLNIGDTKYVVSKCDTNNFNNETNIAFLCKNNTKLLSSSIKYKCIDGKWEPKELPKCESKFFFSFYVKSVRLKQILVTSLNSDYSKLLLFQIEMQSLNGHTFQEKIFPKNVV